MIDFLYYSEIKKLLLNENYNILIHLIYGVAMEVLLDNMRSGSLSSALLGLGNTLYKSVLWSKLLVEILISNKILLICIVERAIVN